MEVDNNVWALYIRTSGDSQWEYLHQYLSLTMALRRAARAKYRRTDLQVGLMYGSWRLIKSKYPPEFTPDVVVHQFTGWELDSPDSLPRQSQI